MNLSQIIKSRVSNSNFNSNEVNHHELIDLLDTAVYAPNHKMREPWRFIILQNEGKESFVEKYIGALNEVHKEKFEPSIRKVFSAPAVVAFIMPTNQNLNDEIEDMEAVAMVIQNFLLLATEVGLATSLKTPAYFETDQFKEQMGLKAGEMIIGLVMVGYSDFTRLPKPRKSAATLTTLYK